MTSEASDAISRALNHRSEVYQPDSAAPYGPFLLRLLQKVMHDASRRQSHNTDEFRFPHRTPGSRFKASARQALDALLDPAGCVYVGRSQWKRQAEKLATIVTQFDQFQTLYCLLRDEESRTLLVDLLAYRVLGGRHVKLPRNTREYQKAILMIQRDLLSPRVARSPELDQLDDYDLSPLGVPICIRAHLLNVLNTFVLQQYRLDRPGRVIEVRSGDVVIDAGACWGDTALYFANLTGPSGTVVAYEFEPDNLELLRQNLVDNPTLAERVRVVASAVWSTPDQEMNFRSAGAGTRLDTAMLASNPSVMTDTIDRRVQIDKLPSVNFIKMDIEGAELNALRGAEQTLKEWKPELAISVYHDLQHFWQIPAFIDSLNLGYRFYLDHFTIHEEETVLFASAA